MLERYYGSEGLIRCARARAGACAAVIVRLGLRLRFWLGVGLRFWLGVGLRFRLGIGLRLFIVFKDLLSTENCGVHLSSLCDSDQLVDLMLLSDSISKCMPSLHSIEM